MPATSLPAVFPRPRTAELLGGSGSLEVTAVEHARELPAQGYVLLVQEAGTRIRHADDAGLRYARHTLAQLAAASDVPAVHIVDHPDLPHRGYMLDVSRDRVPTNETLAWLVDLLAELRYDHLELYVEHTFAYAGHEDVWAEASPLTIADVHDLDTRCRAAWIELVANQNTFGHMERWLRHDTHRWRAECPDGATSPFTGRPMPPTTLAPTAENATFALSLVRELLAAHSSTTVNIGADEPFELGQGVSSTEVAERGRDEVYLDHLQRLVRPLVDEGHDVLFWADVLRRRPDLVAALPSERLAAVVWNYEAPATDGGLLGRLGPELLEALGLPDDFHRGFSSHTRSFVDTGVPFWVAGGTSTWNTLIGRWPNARGNLLDAAEVGRDAGAAGLLVTDWGDNGHLQPLVASLLPLVHGAGVGWCAATNAAVDVASEVDRLTGTPGLGGLLADVGTAYLDSGVETFNGSPLFAALDPGRPLALIGKGEPDAHGVGIERLEAALDTASSIGAADLVPAIRLARHGAWRLARRAGVPVPTDEELAADIAECEALQRERWLATSRPGGLDDSLRHLPI